MSIGLDLGTTEFRSIRFSGNELAARRCRAVYLVLRDTPGHRRLLSNTHMSHAICGEDLVLFGEEAIECATMLDLTVTPLLKHGRLPSTDPVARQILSLMLEGVLPAADHFGTICCLTPPGGYGANEDQNSADIRFFKQIVTLRGYTPKLTTPGLAVVLTELAKASFSGLGISLGATGCEISVVHCGRELTRWSTVAKLSVLAEEFPLEGINSAPKSTLPEPQQIGWNRLCSKMLTSLFSEAREALIAEGSVRLIPQPSQIVCTGGITQASGFAELFEQAWNESNWPIKTAKVRIAADPSLVIARGCLIQAFMNASAKPNRRAA